VAVKYGVSSTLGSILVPSTYHYAGNMLQKPDALFYETLDMSLKELEQRKLVRVTWLPEGISKEESFDLMIPRTGVVADVLDSLQRKAGISDELMPKVHIYEAHSSKFFKYLPMDYSILSIGEFFSLYAECFPEDDSPKRISVFHFDKEPNKVHGVPFQFPLKEGEQFKDTKVRLSEFIKIKGKQFEKIKFAVVGRPHYSKPEYLEDDEILFDALGSREEYALGLDHVNKSRNNWNKSDSIFIR